MKFAFQRELARSVQQPSEYRTTCVLSPGKRDPVKPLAGEHPGLAFHCVCTQMLSVCCCIL